MQGTLDLGLGTRLESFRNAHRAALYSRYSRRLIQNPDLTRALVSFQANKQTPFYRWLKYKEGFSSEFVLYCLDRYRPSGISVPRILDPFAGAGTTLTTATSVGWHATGIELMPVGTSAIRARLLADTVNIRLFQQHLSRLENFSLGSSQLNGSRFPHLRITEKAFPGRTERALSSYGTFLAGIRDENLRFLFRFACLSVLEDVSYTRKDGQYLRWDLRSGRSLKSSFNKGTIHDFRSAIIEKLQTMLEDIGKRNGGSFSRNVDIIAGSCLDELPKLRSDSFNLVITSPPYCNRYDYTRTYALELAYLGYNEETLKQLRQTLLSATVENKTKRHQLAYKYRSRKQEIRYNSAVAAFTDQHALQEVLTLLYKAQKEGKLNNDNIPMMVENYFFEMNLVIRELARVLAPGGRIIMVNDNVQYNGEEVPVDLILSDLASSAGLMVDHIWVLPRGKGNSSQQMGAHGRNELRKCVYVWSKPNKRS